MCSSAGDIEDLSNCSREIQNIVNIGLFQKCKKCEEKSVVLLQKKDPFCKSCFFEYSNHKFRSTIGKSKKIKHGEKVLLACSGGRKSSALLHMTRQTLKSASLKQISFLPGILFVDDSFITSDLSKDAHSDVCSIIEDLKSSEYVVWYSSLEMVYKINTEETLYSSSDVFLSGNFPFNHELQSKLQENFKTVPLSSKIDLLKHLRLLLITEISKQAGYDYVFVGDTADSLAVELLSDIAIGRGSQICSDTSFYDTRYKVPVIRPLREFSSKEVTLYNHLHKTSYKVLPDLLTKTPFNSCIQRVTEAFLSNLQENFPATIFTVFRTGSKLSRNNVLLDARTCIICKSQLDNTNPDLCSALEALKLSEKISTSSPEYNHNMNLLQFLCHGCSKTFCHMSKGEAFHSLIPDVSCTKLKRDEMKEEIKEYLLDQNEEDS